MEEQANTNAKWKVKAFNIIFKADTPGGKLFDAILLVAIFFSVLAVILESVGWIRLLYGTYFLWAEWIFTAFFLIEYIIRIIIVKKPWHYIKSFFGIVDLLSILPSLLAFFFVGAQSLMIIRGLRLLRIFRIFKLTQYLGEASQLSSALLASRKKITLFIGTVLILVSILGAIMYLIEPPESGFTNIPKGIYWSIVTLTTVGYGDIAPITALGQIVASLIMIMGYGIIAVPTGIVTSEMNKNRFKMDNRSCQSCGATQHGDFAKFCHNCGKKLPIAE
ncbi:ion transporter [Marivirga harenae]|uniref:ion transporter n=1 Tax=Marivirga harenae TaxID=2010992 RepID=UPI0026DECEAA|nr:ion transporter [Marivirga harenae]WKV11987.1 ion transporter [Marivirga harenae]|tara:strand:+ start:94733 stop:95563 length:831 start_codon:yes stop_codon:yes gene_type:complete